MPIAFNKAVPILSLLKFVASINGKNGVLPVARSVQWMKHSYIKKVLYCHPQNPKA